MSYVVTLKGFTPESRYDAKPWTTVVVEEAVAQGGPFSVVDTQVLSPVDADPTHPATRNVTTTLAALPTGGWYRLTFKDADGNQQRFDPVAATAAATPTSIALVTHAEARAYLGVDADEKPTDAWLDLAINGLSAHIQDATGRRYLPQSSNASDTVIVDHDGTLTVEIPDAVTVAKVEIASDVDTGDWVTLDPSWWVAKPSDSVVKETIRFVGDLNTWPATNRGWIFGGRQASGLATRTPWPREARAESTMSMAVRVTGKFGQGQGSDNAKLALLMWIKAVHRRDGAFFSRDVGDNQNLGVPRVPDDVQKLIDAESRTPSQGGTVTAV